MMQAILLYAFAAAVLGGLESPAGSVIGGWRSCERAPLR
jgi:branched-subunit amino acid ABC-type transport system permease component